MANFSETIETTQDNSDQVSFSSTLELTCRTLPLNSKDEIHGLLSVLRKIISNINSEPLNIKYRTLKLQNKTLRNKIFDRDGAKEIMYLLGFHRLMSEDTHEASMILPLDIKDKEIQLLSKQMIDNLNESWLWLENQLKMCLEMQGTQISCCAECLIQIRLPNGKILKCGFFSDEPLQTVIDFLNAARPLLSHEGMWLLSQTHPQIMFSDEYLTMSLKSLELIPRASLIAQVSVQNLTPEELKNRQEEYATMLLKQAYDNDNNMRMKQERLLRQSKSQESDALKKDRERVLKEFNEDRARARERQLLKSAALPSSSSLTSTSSLMTATTGEETTSTTLQRGK